MKPTWFVFVLSHFLSFAGAYSSGGLSTYIPLTEDNDDVGEGRFFLNDTFLAFAALSLFPLLFLASAVGGSLIQWYWSYHSSSKCDEHYYSSGYGGGHSSYGGDSYGHGGYGHDDHRRSDGGYDYDYDRSLQKRSTNAEIELSGMSHCFLVQ